MEMIAKSSREDFYRIVEHVQQRIHFYNQQNSQKQIEWIVILGMSLAEKDDESVYWLVRAYQDD